MLINLYGSRKLVDSLGKDIALRFLYSLSDCFALYSDAFIVLGDEKDLSAEKEIKVMSLFSSAVI